MRKMLLGFIFGLSGFSATAEPVTIAALGDSLTQGYGLAQPDGFVAQLDSWLEDQGVDVVVINAGVSGDTTAGGAARIAWTLAPQVDALIVTLGANDLLRGIAPEVARANMHKIMAKARDTGIKTLLVGFVAPGNFGPKYKAEFDAIYPDLAREYGALYAGNFFAGIMDPDGGIIVRLLQDDGLHPTREGVARIVDVLGPDVLTLVGDVQKNR